MALLLVMRGWCFVVVMVVVNNVPAAATAPMPTSDSASVAAV
jgi:hypothetical protein